jgi:hypothetical protein
MAHHGGGTPTTCEEVYEDFCGRRASLVAALTTGASLAGRWQAGCAAAGHASRAHALHTRLLAARRPPRPLRRRGDPVLSPTPICTFVDVSSFFEQCDPNKARRGRPRHARRAGS